VPKKRRFYGCVPLRRAAKLKIYLAIPIKIVDMAPRW